MLSFSIRSIRINKKENELKGPCPVRYDYELTLLFLMPLLRLCTSIMLVWGSQVLSGTRVGFGSHFWYSVCIGRICIVISCLYKTVVGLLLLVSLYPNISILVMISVIDSDRSGEDPCLACWLHDRHHLGVLMRIIERQLQYLSTVAWAVLVNI